MTGSVLPLAPALLAVLAVAAVAQHVADRRDALGRRLRPLASATLAGGVARSVVLLAIVPALALAAMTLGRRAADLHERDRTLVSDAALGVGAQVEALVTRHVAGVRSAAEAIGFDARPQSGRMEQWLLRYHPIYPDFLTMLATDARGEIVAATRFVDGRIAGAGGSRRSVADRDYFRTPMSTGRDFVSPAFRGRGLGTDPLVAIASPVVVDGRRIGVVEGSLDLRVFERIDRQMAKLLGATLVLVDGRGRVIYAHPRSGYTFLQAVRERPLGAALARFGATEVDGVDGTRLLAGHARTSQGWHVLIVKPGATLAAAFGDVLAVAAQWFVLCALFAGALAWALARRVTRPLRSLDRALRAYEVGRRSPFRRVERLPLEYRAAFRHLHGFAVRHATRDRQLRESLANAERLHAELEAALEDRERVILERTRELAVANHELQRLSRTDALTGLPNRRAFDESWERMRRLALRDAAPLAAILLDVDRFKAYNDRYGHPAGDAVLKRVAAVLPGCLNRPADVAARYGGEEFAVILGETPLEGAAVVAERIRAAVEALGLVHDGADGGLVTVSLGVAAAWPSPRDTHGAALLQRADDALYRAKQAGRNRVAVDDPELAVAIPASGSAA